MFKKNQKVWCLIYGHGVITEVDNKRSEDTYPVLVKFQNIDNLIISYTADGKFHNLGNITLFPHPVEVIKALTKPSVNWEHVSSEFKYLAEDADGGVFLYEDKPYTSTETWMVDNGDLVEAHILASYTKGTCDWKESLVKRPEGDSHDD